MFGHDDKNDDNQQPINTKPVNPGLLGIDEETESPTTPEPAIIAPSAPSLPTVPDPAVISDPATSDPNSVVPEPTAQPVNNIVDPSSPDSQSSSPDVTDVSVTPTPTSSEPATNDQLVSIKRQALAELSPLINHLDQSADEKFKTTMMMIQASDNKDLIPQAFNSAKEITDEKQRAQALLDLVNEINYFTHKAQE